MTSKSQNQSDSKAQLTVDDADNFEFLTEEEFERASDAVQVRHLIERNETQVLARDDVTLRHNAKILGPKEGTYVRYAIYEVVDGFCFFEDNHAEENLVYYESISDCFDKFQHDVEKITGFYSVENLREVDSETLALLTI